MKAEEFVAKLATLDPPINVEKYEDAEPLGDELVALVVNYDVANIYLGDIRFGEEAYEDEETFEVGQFEEKFLIIDRESGEVRVEDDDDEGTVMYSCAESSEKFLDALWSAVQYLSFKLNQPPKESDLETCRGRALECAEIAGSEDYYPFYQDLLDCYE